MPSEGYSWYADAPATIYDMPVTLSALAFHILTGIAGGIVGAWIYSKDSFWIMSGALASIISVTSGLDIYFPALALIMAFTTGVILKPCANILERMVINDTVGAFTLLARSASLV